MRLLIQTVLCLSLFPIILNCQSGCQHKANLIITSLNFASGCPFGDSGGLDPVLEIFNPDGTQLYIMHLSDLNQVTGPVQNLVLDFSDAGNPNTCPEGNYSPRFCLGPQPIEDEVAIFTVRIYEKSSNFANPTCGGYFSLFDRNFGEANFHFDFTQPSGTIDVGSCISFNYELSLDYTGLIEEEITGPLCPESNLIIDGTIYDINNPSGQLIKQGINSCDTIVDIDLSFYSVPDIDLFGDLTFCPSSFTEIGITNASAYETFLWNTSELTSSIVISNPGDYSVIATTINACSKEITFSVDTFTVAEFNIIGQDFICENSLIDLRVTGNPAQVLWDDGSTDPLLIISEAGTYAVTTTDANGCTSSTSKQVLSSAAPTITFVGDQDICAGESTTLTTIENHSTYLWSDQSENESLEASASGLYSVTVTDINGCSNSSSLMITVTDAPQPQLEGVQDFCFGESILLSSAVSYEAYLWDNGSTTAELTIEDSGSYSLQVTDTNGCTGTTSAIVIESAELTPSITGDLMICQGESGTISLEQSYETMQWEDGSNLQALQVSNPGVYTVTVTDVSGCTASAEADVIVLDELQPQLIGGNSFCAGGSLTLGLSTTYASQIWSDNTTDSELIISAAGTYAVTVTDNNGCTGTSATIISETTSIENSIEILTCDSTQLGTNIIPLISAQGCDSIVTQTTIFDPACLLRFDIEVFDADCIETANGSITITFTQGLADFEAILVFNGQPVESFNSINAGSVIEFDGLSPGTYQLIFPAQEQANTEFTVFTNDENLVGAEQVVILEGSSTLLQANLSGLSASTFGWQEGDQELCASNCSEIEVMPSSTTTYTFIAETEEGCVWIDSTQVIVNLIQSETQTYIPNIFNPEAAGEDKTFKIFSNNSNFSYSMNIYDRWGNLVFTGDQNSSWDGFYGGRRAESGVYVYQLTLLAESLVDSERIAGAFLLIR